MTVLIRPVVPPELTTRHEELWRRSQRLHNAVGSTSRTAVAQGTNRTAGMTAA